MAQKNQQMTETIFRLINYFISGSDKYPLWNVEAEKKMSPVEWNYVDGFIILAFIELYKATGDKKYLDFSDAFIDRFVRNNGHISTFQEQAQRLDDINGAKTFIPLFELTGKEKYRMAADYVYGCLQKFPRTKEGNFIHKKIYPSQVWLDGLYMAMPFYMEYEIKYNHMRNCFDIYNQFMNIQRLMRDPKTGLYYHGYDESREADWSDPVTGCSKNFWLRSVGWLVMALVDTLEKMDEQIYYEYRMLGNMLKKLIDSLLFFQSPNGMFYQVIDRGGENKNYLETSGTCMIAYGILKAVRLRVLPERYRIYGETAFWGTVDQYFMIKDGKPTLGGICLVGGLGGAANRNGSPEYYYSEPVVENDGKGVAPFLLAFTELLREYGDE